MIIRSADRGRWLFGYCIGMLRLPKEESPCDEIDVTTLVGYLLLLTIVITLVLFICVREISRIVKGIEFNRFSCGLLAGQQSLGFFVSDVGASRSLARLESLRSVCRLGGDTLAGSLFQASSVRLSGILGLRFLLVVAVAEAERIVLIRLRVRCNRGQGLPLG